MKTREGGNCSDAQSMSGCSMHMALHAFKQQNTVRHVKAGSAGLFCSAHDSKAAGAI